MKKLILTMVVCLFTFSVVNAKTNDKEPKKTKEEKTETIIYYKVNAFCKLIKMGNYDAVKDLILAGENINTKSTGLTPLMFAARYNKAEIVKLLIDKGAKLKTKSDKRVKMTALQIANISKAVDAIKVIEEAM